MKKHHVDIMISEADVRSRIAELGAEITHCCRAFTWFIYVHGRSRA